MCTDTVSIKKTFIAVDLDGKWLTSTEGTNADDINKQLLECFLSNKMNRKRLPAWIDSGCKIRERIEPIDIEVWVPNPDKPGYLQLGRTKTIYEVEAELKARLKADGYWEYLDYFDICAALNEKETKAQTWPKHRWIACYVVTGGSEGYYVHVDIVYGGQDVIIDQYGKNKDVWCRRLIFLGKLLSDHNMAWEIAKACGNHLGA
jgi:hypothetical protein